MIGTVVNSIGIFAGAIGGAMVKEGLKERYKTILMQAIPLGVIIIGLQPALSTKNPLLFIISLVLGGLIGEWVNIENKLESLGLWMQKRIKGETNIAQGFIEASLIFCIGSMAVLGAMDDGLKGDSTILFTKAILDGITSFILASTLGIGVFLSGFAVFLYQGSITLIFMFLKTGIDQSSISIHEMSAVGGILITCIGLNMLKITKIKVGNLLPTILVPIVYYVIFK